MSRTWKDRPLRVQLHENMKKGLIDHDHTEATVREGLSYGFDRTLSKTYYKWATKAINEYKNYLDSLGDTIVYEMVEHGPSYDYDASVFFNRIEYREKTIEFQVRKRYRYEGNDLCTDAENYDNLTHTDKRNGKRARCTPRYTHDLYSRWDPARKNEYSRVSVKAALKKARDLANVELLDEDYSDPVVEERYAKKVWTWDD